MIRRSTLGVKIFLDKRVRVPKWIDNYFHYYSVDRTSLGGKCVRCLTIEDAEADFFPGGSVAVSVRTRNFLFERVAFKPGKVLEIQTLSGKLIRRNHLFCVKCVTNTGVMADFDRADVAGRINATFQCSQCSFRWKLKNI